MHVWSGVVTVAARPFRFESKQSQSTLASVSQPTPGAWPGSWPGLVGRHCFFSHTLRVVFLLFRTAAPGPGHVRNPGTSTATHTHGASHHGNLRPMTREICRHCEGCALPAALAGDGGSGNYDSFVPLLLSSERVCVCAVTIGPSPIMSRVPLDVLRGCRCSLSRRSASPGDRLLIMMQNLTMHLIGYFVQRSSPGPPPPRDDGCKHRLFVVLVSNRQTRPDDCMADF